MTTYEAYNSWPTPQLEWPGDNKCLYEHESPRRSRRVSFNRPNLRLPMDFPKWEGAFLDWAEKEGITIDCCTSLDLHRDPVLLSKYQLLLSVGHDEYWTKEMRDNVENFVTSGGNVAFFGGNTCQWQIRLEDDDRSIVCYKNALEDPLTGVDNTRVTVEWYDAPIERPTNTLTGVSFRNGAGYGWGGIPSVSQEEAAYHVRFPEHWVFNKAPIGPDGAIGRGENIVGYETDAAEYIEQDGIPRATGRDGTPENFVILATADLRSWHGAGQGGYATMGIFQRQGTVFTTATIDWSRGLTISGSAVPQITRNVIHRLREPLPIAAWQLIGTSTKISSLATFERQFFGLGTDGRLWHRDATPQNVPWRHIDNAAGMNIIASTEADTMGSTGRIVAAKADVLMWRHGEIDKSDWHAFGHLPSATVVDITYTNNAFFAVHEDTLIWRVSSLIDASWHRLDDADEIISLESWWNILIALTADKRVLWRTPETSKQEPWNYLCDAPSGSCAIGAAKGRLVAVTTDGSMWWRSLG